jgi:transglutaminase-like putative cysteine protease
LERGGDETANNYSATLTNLALAEDSHSVPDQCDDKTADIQRDLGCEVQLLNGRVRVTETEADDEREEAKVTFGTPISARKTRLRNYRCGCFSSSRCFCLPLLGFVLLITSYELESTDHNARLDGGSLFRCGFSRYYSVRKSGLFALICPCARGVYGRFVARGGSVCRVFCCSLSAQSPLRVCNCRKACNFFSNQRNMEEAQLLLTHAAQAIVFVVSFLSAFFIISEPSVPGLALSTLPLLLPAPFYLLSHRAAAVFFMLFAAHMNGVCVQQRQARANHVSRRRLCAAEQTESEPARPRAASIRSRYSRWPLIALAAIYFQPHFTAEGYQRPDAIEDLNNNIFFGFRQGRVLAQHDGLTRGDLTNLSSIRFSGKTALLVRVSDPLSLYIRDYAGALYTEDGWENVIRERFFIISEQRRYRAAKPARLRTRRERIDAIHLTLSVSKTSAPRRINLDAAGLITHADEITNAAYVQDTALAFCLLRLRIGLHDRGVPVGMSLYSVPNADNGFEKAYKKAAGSADGLNRASGDDADTVRDTASTYIGYLFDTYTTLPDVTQEAADKLLETYDIHAIYDGDALNLAATCQSIRSLLADRCSYDYSPPEMPEGADFATWFLEDAQSGYCVHFATTATVLLRALGIPARYAEGYIVIQKDYNKTPDANGFIKIEDTHAPAWVEVFDPSILEWVPVEVTESTQQSSEPTHPNLASRHSRRRTKTRKLRRNQPRNPRLLQRRSLHRNPRRSPQPSRKATHRTKARPIRPPHRRRQTATPLRRLHPHPRPAVMERRTAARHRTAKTQAKTAAATALVRRSGRSLRCSPSLAFRLARLGSENISTSG